MTGAFKVNCCCTLVTMDASALASVWVTGLQAVYQGYQEIQAFTHFGGVGGHSVTSVPLQGSTGEVVAGAAVASAFLHAATNPRETACGMCQWPSDHSSLQVFLDQPDEAHSIKS